ncbi:MAG TPA: universal stress protein [Candidatus Limnocylindria bacterium]
MMINPSISGPPVIDAELVIVGSHNHGALVSFALGSVAAEVVDHAPCPVLIARNSTLGPIVLGHDGSESALLAEQLVAEWPFLAREIVRVVNVSPLLPPWYMGADLGMNPVIDGEFLQTLLDGNWRPQPWSEAAEHDPIDVAPGESVVQLLDVRARHAECRDPDRRVDPGRRSPGARRHGRGVAADLGRLVDPALPALSWAHAPRARLGPYLAAGRGGARPRDLTDRSAHPGEPR